MKNKYGIDCNLFMKERLVALVHKNKMVSGIRRSLVKYKLRPVFHLILMKES